jgi:adenosylmethionine-8-amino-7-oxononanoate aminotransferase
VLSRDIAYHGTSMGALAITGLPGIKAPFEPMAPGGVRVPNTNFYRAPDFVADDLEAFGRWAADEIDRAIEREGPESVAAVFLEPVQNSGGCFPPPPGYFARVREICDRHGVLLVSDEVICAFGRLGHYFGAQRYGYQPDIITFAKGVTSGYSPLGGMMVSDALMEPFGSSHEDISGFESPRHVGHAGGPGRSGTATFLHGVTFAGHPVSTAVALANLDVFEKEDTCSATSAATRRRSGPRWRSSTTCRSSATSAATGTSTGSSWSRTRPPGRRSPTTSPSGCCAASCPPRCTTPA